jgi:hypothetical protein
VPAVVEVVPSSTQHLPLADGFLSDLRQIASTALT